MSTYLPKITGPRHGFSTLIGVDCKVMPDNGLIGGDKAIAIAVRNFRYPLYMTERLGAVRHRVSPVLTMPSLVKSWISVSYSAEDARV